MPKHGIKKPFRISITVTFLTALLLMLPACAPSFPKENLTEFVKTVYKIEYDMDVDITVIDKTIGIYYPMKDLMDAGMGISEQGWDQISNLLLIASRVVLSTDADIQFYCVITQDIKLPELQVVIIKYVGDIKLGMYRNISRTESFKRTLFSVNLTPQAQKERSIEMVFDKLNLTDETKQTVMEDFFRSPPAKLSDIGYWRGKFYLKNITMEEFLADQISNRVKHDFRVDKKLTELFKYKTSESLFTSEEGTRSFLVKFKIMDQLNDDADMNLRVKKIQEIVRIANEVILGYKFRNFDFLILEDQLENVKLTVNSQNVYDFDSKKQPVEDIVRVVAGYFS